MPSHSVQDPPFPKSKSQIPNPQSKSQVKLTTIRVHTHNTYYTTSRSQTRFYSTYPGVSQSTLPNTHDSNFRLTAKTRNSRSLSSCT
ncbi:hypothetical protein BDN72DRAFT_435300 [Pluteus cervinus]|uniref:Uncharacterized protein n=1 Tax=Pluteus cervinus TaxID=181527 RepID=A0ACD3A6X2_9AGAR|nr:hypothetical protein BDN72DRAFT_435300 [Pluteus cervinus]